MQCAIPRVEGNTDASLSSQLSVSNTVSGLWPTWPSRCPREDNTLNSFFKILFIFRERGREGEREGEVHQLIASRTYAAEDPACNPGRCPDWELNLRPLGLQAGTQSTELHQPGPNTSMWGGFPCWWKRSWIQQSIRQLGRHGKWDMVWQSPPINHFSWKQFPDH